MPFDYHRFWVLSEGFKRGAFRVHALGMIPDPDALTHADVAPDEPIRFHHDQGGRLYDFIGTTWAVLDLVSDRFVTLLRDNGFTGWKTFPVAIYNKGGKEVPGYHGLAVTGRCGPIDESLSPVMTLPSPVPQGEAMPHRIGLRFSPETWDGSDVFSPEGTTFVFINGSVRNTLVKARIGNIRLQRLTEFAQLVIPAEHQSQPL